MKVFKNYKMRICLESDEYQWVSDRWVSALFHGKW